MKLFLMGILFFSVMGVAQEKKDSISVYFNSNEASLCEVAKTDLKALISNPERDFTSINVNGFCDDVGSTEANEILSNKRAQTVANFLNENLDLKVTSYKGKGEIELKPDDTSIEAIRAQNRRAMVYFTYTLKIQETITAKKEYKTIGESLTIGDKVIIENLIFKGSRTAFEDKSVAETELIKIVTYFKNNPNLQFEIQGHVCCITDYYKDARNKETGLDNLSEARAKLIYDFMLKEGIAKERMQYKGYGRQFPRRDKKEYENKRVEIVINAV
jgi:outer membrane protein OmpA-like peptidoglycan-associated protein